jgi:AcrR family transcriptional regulator
MAHKTAQGLETRQGILEVAAKIGSVEGLGGLTLGRLAAELAMSKSGLFAHFGSKEELQLATIEHARQLYVEEVIIPGLAHPRGIASLYGLCDEYVALMERGVFPGGCFFASAMAEFDARPGPVRDRVAEVQRLWLDLLERAARDAIHAGELRPTTDPGQLAFELEAAMLSSNWYYHLYSDPEFFRRARQAVQTSLELQATAKGRRALDGALAASSRPN